MICCIILFYLIKSSLSFDVFSDLAYDDPLTNYADNLNNRLSGLAEECTGSTGIFGTCRNSIHCRLLGGSPTGRGSCRSFLDTCCSVNRGCGRITKTKVSTFVNPTNVPQDGGECYYTAFIVNTNICQVRIDFNTTMTEPVISGTVNLGQCAEDRITFEDGEGAQTPTICGRNTNQHIYLRVNNALKSIRIRAHFTRRTGTNILISSSWLIKVTQLECPGINTELLNPYHRMQAAADFPKLAPRGCLQYYIPTEGTIESFNSNGFTVPRGALYEPSLEYSMCFYRPRDACRVNLRIMGALDRTSDPTIPPITILYASELKFSPRPRNNLLRMSDVNNETKKIEVRVTSNSRTGRENILRSGMASGDTRGPFYIKFKSQQVVGIGFTINYQTDLPCGDKSS